MSDTSTYLGGLVKYTGLVNLFPDPNGTRYQFWNETRSRYYNRKKMAGCGRPQIDIDAEQLSFPNGN